MTVNRAHDGSNRVTALQDGSGATQATYSYDSLDRPTGMTLGNGTSVAYNYDLLNRVSSINNTLGGTVTRNYAYVYDAASRRTSETGPRGAVAYGYTNRNEVNAVTEPSGSPFSDQGFAYDAGFNRSQWINGSATTSYAVNNLNQYTTVSGGTAPVWNSDGGLAGYNGNTYIYDALMRLVEVDNASGKYLFSYDPTGRRVKKVIESTTGAVLQTYAYHYDGSEVAVEYQPSVTWTYYLGLGIDQPVMRVSGATKQWYYANAQGSISAVADNSGTILEQYEYNAQGQFQVQNGSGTPQAVTRIGNFILYTGRNYDYETGNYFYRARYYSPVLGRFISRDPLSGAEFSQGTNLYAYCGNNFVNLTDPSGNGWMHSLGETLQFMGEGEAVIAAGLALAAALTPPPIDAGLGIAALVFGSAAAEDMLLGHFLQWLDPDNGPPATNPSVGNWDPTPPGGGGDPSAGGNWFISSSNPSTGNWDPTAPGGGGDPSAGNWDPTAPGGGGDPTAGNWDPSDPSNLGGQSLAGS